MEHATGAPRQAKTVRAVNGAPGRAAVVSLPVLAQTHALPQVALMLVKSGRLRVLGQGKFQVRG